MHTFCKFEYTEEKGFLKCINCGRVKRTSRPPEQSRAYCGKSDLPLGDILESGLSKIGVTQERVEKIVKGCGCKKAQKALNEAGQRIVDIGSSILNNLGLTSNDQDNSE